jgi:hypothetical protein
MTEGALTARDREEAREVATVDFSPLPNGTVVPLVVCCG